MANHFSSLKRIRITDRRTAVNQMRKSRLRNAIRTMRRALDKKDAAAATALLPKTFSLVDRASKWGIIKVNTAARYKSRLHLRLKALTTPAAA
jgi:small subunit ribosomal protein S20